MGLQRKAEDSTPIEHIRPAVQNVLNSRGEPLDVKTRAFMEPRFHEDFSNVRVHNDGAAFESTRVLHAKAFTYGPHIAFSSGRFQTGNIEGQALLAHELAHVVQQRRGEVGSRAALESDADAASQSVFGTGGVDVRGASPPRVAREGEEQVPWWKRKLASARQSASAVAERVTSAPSQIKAAVGEQYGSAQQTLHTASQNVAARLETTKAEVTTKLTQIGSKDNRANILDQVQRQIHPTTQLAEKSASARQKSQAALTSAQRSGTGVGRATAFNALVTDADDFVQAWNRLEVEPQRAAAGAWKAGGFGAAVTAGQKSSDHAINDLTGTFKKALADFDDGKFIPPAKTVVDPNAHPTLAAAEAKAIAGSDKVSAFERQAVSGVATALWSMGTGITSLTVHPVNSIKGLGELPGPSGVALAVSPLGAIKTVGQGVGLVDDLAASKKSPSVAGKEKTPGQVLAEYGKKQLPNAERDKEQTTNLLKAVGENYIEAAGYKLETDQKDPEKRRIVDKGDKARLGRIPGLLLVDVGSFFLPGGSGTKGAKLASGAGEAAGALRVGEGLGQAEKVAQAGRGLGKGAEGIGELGKAADIGADASKTTALAQEARQAEQAIGAASESKVAQGASTTRRIPLLDDALERVKKLFGESKPANDAIPPAPEPQIPTVPAGATDAAAEGKLIDLPPDRARTPTPSKFKEGSPSVQPITDAKRPPSPYQEAKAVREALENEKRLAEAEQTLELEAPQEEIAAGAERRGTVAARNSEKAIRAGRSARESGPGQSGSLERSSPGRGESRGRSGTRDSPPRRGSSSTAGGKATRRKPPTKDPGEWLDDFAYDNMREQDAAYQERAAGSPKGKGYYVGNVQFDGITHDGTLLLDAKHYLDPGAFTQNPGYRQTKAWELLKDARRQIRAARPGNNPIQWRVASPKARDLIKQLFKSWEIDIDVIYWPP